MGFLLTSIPTFDCLVRREFTRDLKAGHGEFLEATAVAVMSVRADSLWFQTVLKEPYGGVAFLLPIVALVTKPCALVDTKVCQPWDCFSSSVGVEEIVTFRRSAVRLLKDNCLAQYQFTIASTGNDLADNPAQRKLLHVVLREDGLIGAYPNNRCVFLDRALFGDLTEKPDFMTLTKEFRAEGLPHVQGSPPNLEYSDDSKPLAQGYANLNGIHTDPKERPEWLTLPT